MDFQAGTMSSVSPVVQEAPQVNLNSFKLMDHLYGGRCFMDFQADTMSSVPPVVQETLQVDLNSFKLMDLATNARFKIKPLNYNPNISLRETMHGWWKIKPTLPAETQSASEAEAEPEAQALSEPEP